MQTNVRSLAAMKNYLGRRIPNLQTTMKPINDLLCTDTRLEWGRRQIEALDKIKAKLVSAKSLDTLIQNVKPPLIV